MSEQRALPSTSNMSDWVRTAYRQRPEHAFLNRSFGRTHVRRWGEGDKPPVILVHGTAANSSWWDHIAPHLADRRTVAAIDLSGHGDSDWRQGPYRLASWAEEVLAVVELVDTGGSKPIVIGHSMGGLVTLKAALLAPEQLSGLAILDIAARHISPEQQASRDLRASKASPLFATQQLALEKFRPLGADEQRHLPEVVAHIAAESIVRTNDGWTWKLDRNVFARDPLPIDALARTELPTLIVRAEHGALTEIETNAMAERLGWHASTAFVQDAGHHIMLDQPAALTSCLRAWIEPIPG